jgi:hypothetical protein
MGPKTRKQLRKSTLAPTIESYSSTETFVPSPAILAQRGLGYLVEVTANAAVQLGPRLPLSGTSAPAAAFPAQVTKLTFMKEAISSVSITPYKKI